MTAEQLLQELEALTHKARIGRMIGLGRSAARDPEVAATLTILKRGDFYQRFLAIHSCFGSRDGSHVLQALTDPSRIIRGLAINLVPLACTEEQLQQALTIVPRDGRLPLLWKLRHLGNDTLIDQFLENLAATNDLQLQKLLPIGSPALVRRLIVRFLHRMGLVDWRRLARRHPTIAFELLQTRAGTTTNLDLQLLSFVNGILPILAHKQPDLAIMLVRTLTRSTSLDRMNLRALALLRPMELTDLILEKGEGLDEIDSDLIAHRLDNARLLALSEIRPAVYMFSQFWIHRMQPERRALLYSAFVQAWHNQNIRISEEVVATLPHIAREQEARRHLASPELATRPERRLPYAAFLPWDEARCILDPFFHDPHIKIRTIVLNALTQVVRYERERLPELLTILCKHLNEPDPVRGAILKGLTELPRSIWNREHLDALGQIIDAIINASDTSSFTAGELLHLLTRLFTCEPEWSAARFASVVQAHGFTLNYSNDDTFSNADIRLIGPALRPILLSWAENKNEKALEETLFLFGKRIHAFDELLEALELAFMRGVSFDLGNTILSYMIQYRPARAAQFIPERVQKNQDWITYPVVSNYLHRQRQDLLTPFLSQRKYSKVFHRLKDPRSRRQWKKPEPLTTGFASWTSRQQAIFARTLLKEIHDETNDQQTLKQAITQLAALPAIPAKHLIALTNNQRPIVRDLALIRLNKLDTDQGMPILLAALQDHRAIRAIYALRPFLLTISVQQALAILHAIPLTKVTTAKEVVRLLGELPGEGAYQKLLELDSQELHRDVRVALLRALWFHLERDETWHILEREAQSADMILALSTICASMDLRLAKGDRNRRRFRWRQRNHFPTSSFSRHGEWNPLTLTSLSGEHLSPTAQRRLMHLFAQLLARPEIEVRASALRECIRLAGADEEQLLLSQLLKAMGSNNEEICAAASRAVFGTCVASDALLIAQAIGRLLPHRSALQTALHVLGEALSVQRRRLLPVVRAVLETLATDPLTIELRIDLAIALLPWDEVVTLLEEALEKGELHAGAVQRAYEKLSWVIGRFDMAARPDVKEMIHLEEKLAANPDERLRRIALAALITQSELPEGWNEERRARLRIYQADPSALVSAAAQFTFPPPNEEG